MDKTYGSTSTGEVKSTRPRGRPKKSSVESAIPTCAPDDKVMKAQLTKSSSPKTRGRPPKISGAPAAKKPRNSTSFSSNLEDDGESRAESPAVKVALLDTHSDDIKNENDAEDPNISSTSGKLQLIAKVGSIIDVLSFCFCNPNIH